MAEEIWKTVIYQGEEFSRLQVSNKGRLKNIKTGTIYKQQIAKSGYCLVSLTLGSEASKKTFRIHKAVAETFIPNPENKPQVNHIDGNKTNNCVENLEWATNLENSHHAWENGLITAHKSERRKLSDEQVRYIREHYIANDKVFGCRPLAKRFGVHHKTMSDIIEYKTYK